MQRPIRRAQVRSKSNTQDQGKAWGSSPPSAAEQQTLRNWDLFKVECYDKLRNWSFQHLKQLTLTRTILFSFLLNSSSAQDGSYTVRKTHMHSIPSQKFPLCNNKYYLQCACPSSKNEQQAKTCTQCKIRPLTWQPWQEQQVVILFEQSHEKQSLHKKYSYILSLHKHPTTLHWTFFSSLPTCNAV